MSSFHIEKDFLPQDEKRKLIRWIDGELGLDLMKRLPRLISLDNFSALAPPTVNDDETRGYSATSLWVVTATERIFVCISAPEGAANWLDITQPGGIGGNNTASNIGDGVGVYDGQVENDLKFRSIQGSDSVAVEEEGGTITLTAPIPTTTTDIAEGDNLYYTDQRVQDHPAVTGLQSNICDFGQAVSATLLVTTTNVTRLLSFATEPDTCYLVELRVLGRKEGQASKAAGYIFNALFTREGPNLVLASEDKLDLESVNGWNATISASGTNIGLDVVGEAQATWKVNARITSV